VQAAVGAIFVGVLAGTIACSKSKPPPPADLYEPVIVRDSSANAVVVEGNEANTPATKTKLEGLFAYSALRSAPAPAPARYAAPLPADAASARGDWSRSPPFEMVADAVCAGDPAMRSKLSAAVASAASKGATVDDLIEGYDKARSMYCSEPSYCRWVGELTESSALASTREFWWYAIEHCDDPATRKRFEAPNVPTRAFVSWYAELYPRPDVMDPRFPSAVQEVIVADLNGEGARHWRLAAVHLSEYDDATAITVAMDLFALPKLDEFVKDGVLLGLRRNRSERAQAFVNARCHELERPECEPSPLPLLPSNDLEPKRGPSSDSLAAWRSLEAELDALGLTVVRRDENPDPTEPSIQAVLEARGRLLAFDTETDTFPNRHEGLMQQLTLLVTPDLDGIIFEEVPPQMTETFEKVDATGGYVLIAYLDGQRYEVDAQDLGDWYDIDAVVGMLNSLCRLRGKDSRFVVLRASDQTSTVVGAPASAIEAATAKGLIVLEEHLGAATEIGTAFEKRVIEAMERGDLP